MDVWVEVGSSAGRPNQNCPEATPVLTFVPLEVEQLEKTEVIFEILQQVFIKDKCVFASFRVSFSFLSEPASGDGEPSHHDAD